MLTSLYIRPISRRSLKIVPALFFVFFGFNSYAQTTAAFPHSTPEAQGVSAIGIDSFLVAVGHSKHEFHSIMILRHGKVIAGGWWLPYAPTLKHTLYSTSKSFTSTAVGFAVSEKLLSVNDKVISFFPHSLPDTVKPYLAALTIKDLLTMSVGMDPDPTTTIPFQSDDWVRSFLATPILNKPGSKFLYNSMATFMLSAIVQKVTGQKEIDYLKPRLFSPLGITGEDWETSNKGINTGGWGLRLKTEDLAKLGQLYLQKGMWKGKQLLPKAWVEEATTFKIDQAPDAPQSKKDSSDWMQGYCYQFWRCRHNAFRADGAFGQYIIIMPDQDAVIAITSETADMQGELNLVWKYLLPAMKPQRLPAAPTADEALARYLHALALPPLAGAAAHPDTKDISGKDFQLAPNSLHLTTARISFSDGLCYLTLKKDSAVYKFSFAAGKWQPGLTNMQGPSLLDGGKENFTFLQPYKISGSYAWTDDNTLQLKLRYIESPHSENITLHITGNDLTATFEKSFRFGPGKVEIKGIAEAGQMK
jgi:CubicO group peptidase (beta-lactamase class C family)